MTRATAVSHADKREGATNIQQVTQVASVRATTNLAITETKTIAVTDTIRMTKERSASYAIWTKNHSTEDECRNLTAAQDAATQAKSRYRGGDQQQSNNHANFGNQQKPILSGTNPLNQGWQPSVVAIEA